MMSDAAAAIVAGPSVVGRFLQTFKEYPPTQRPASFSIDQMQERLLQAFETAGSR